MLSDFSFNIRHSDTIITMNRIQFFVLTGLSSVLFLLILGQVLLSYSVGHAQGEWSQDQQAVQQGNIFQNDLKQLAVRIYSDSSRSTDQGLKDLLARQQITYTPGPATNATETPAAPTR
jgi:hypothetical protein